MTNRPAASTVSFEYLRPPDRRTVFQLELLHASAGDIVMQHVVDPSRPLEYQGEEVMAEGYTFEWFLFKGEPCDVARVYRPDRNFTGYYVDILEPVQWDGDDANTIQPIVDLFLDIWIAPNGGYLLLDEDEFATASETGTLTAEQAESATRTLDRLRRGIEDGSFPSRFVREFELFEDKRF